MQFQTLPSIRLTSSAVVPTSTISPAFIIALRVEIYSMSDTIWVEINTIRSCENSEMKFRRRTLNGLVVGCRYETAAVVTANGTQIETAAAGAMGDTVLLENVSAADTGAATFANTMNEGLSTAGLGRTDRWLTGEDVGFTAEELAALRPAAWYAWERSEGG